MFEDLDEAHGLPHLSSLAQQASAMTIKLSSERLHLPGKDLLKKVPETSI